MPNTGVQTDYPIFTYNKYGKPALASNPDIHFNLSHAGNLVVCALDSFPIGIDIEKLEPIDIDIAKSFCTGDEFRQLKARKEEERLSCFYNIWTIKESYIKAMGKGLAFPITSFGVYEDENGEKNVFPSLGEWYFKQYQIDDGYVLSICAAHCDFPTSVIWIKMEEIMER